MYEILREMRKEKNISAIEMSKLLGLKTAAAYFKKENGSIKFSLDEARKIARYFNRPIEDIFFEIEVSEMEIIDLDDDPEVRKIG